jgi:hypothetical protein
MDAMSRDDRQERRVRHSPRNITDLQSKMHSKLFVPDQALRFMTLTQLDYIENSGMFLKRKVRSCARVEQQIEGETVRVSTQMTFFKFQVMQGCWQQSQQKHWINGTHQRDIH